MNKEVDSTQIKNIQFAFLEKTLFFCPENEGDLENLIKIRTLTVVLFSCFFCDYVRPL